jgi:hypothetical protein
LRDKTQNNHIGRGEYVSPYTQNERSEIMKKLSKLLLIAVVLTLVTVLFAFSAFAADVTTAVDYETETIDTTGYTEYSLNATAWKPIWSDALDVSSLISTSKTVPVYLRADADAAYDTATLPKRPAAPAATDVPFVVSAGDGVDESYIDIDDDYEYSVDLFNWTVADVVGLPVPGAGSASVSVRLAATNSDFASVARTVAVPAAPAKPTAKYVLASDTITPVTLAQEYSVDGGYNWDDVEATALTRTDLGSDEVEVWVRVKATATARPSAITVVVYPGSDATEPTVTLDHAAETLVDDDATMEYKLSSATAWTAVKAANTSVTSLIPAAGKAAVTLQIRVKAVGGAPAGPAAELVLTARPATPTAADVKYTGNVGDTEIGSIADIEDLEYRIGTAGAYDVTDYFEIAPNTSYQFRVPADDTGTESDHADDFFASLPLTVKVPAQAAAPAAVYVADGDKIAPTTTAQEWIIAADKEAALAADLDDWTLVTDTTLTRTALAENTTVFVYVRVAATAAAPASLPKEISVPAAPAGTSGIDAELDVVNELLKIDDNVTSVKYEYRLSTATAWTAVSRQGGTRRGDCRGGYDRARSRQSSGVWETNGKRAVRHV